MTQQRSPNVPESQASADRLGEMAKADEDKMKDVSAAAQALADNIAEQARIYGDKAQKVAREFKPFVEKSMKEKPMQTLAAAAAIAFLLGALWRK
jgi:ElaB/YqjD/DUF883 family membrane-anchored ribosome-binding protein